MENDILKIIEKVKDLACSLYPQVTGDDAEFEILHSIADELLSGAGYIPEEHNEVRRALVNMFLAGRFFPDAPNDEEIEKESLLHDEEYMGEDFFERGAKWMREKMKI